MLSENVHRALHTVFANDTPIQRIRRSLEVDKTTMSPLVYQELSEVLRRFEKIEIEIYKPEIFNPDKFRNKK